MTMSETPAGSTAASLTIAARLAEVSERILSCVEYDDLEEALRLTEERGHLVSELTASGARGPEVEALLGDARRVGRLALANASRRAAELHEQLSTIDSGRSGISAYNPDAGGGGSLDVSR